MNYTPEELLHIYQSFMHRIQMYSVAMNEQKVVEGIHIIQDWSRAHRIGNGELSDEEVGAAVDYWIRKMQEY